MVRAHMKQGVRTELSFVPLLRDKYDVKFLQNDEKKDKKKTSSKKKSQETGVWPCKINGCNKEFAREADLKRHQRTTKLHSTPGLCVSCPQCEATFTRTDALRRHQKSRHNGVIMDPINPDGRIKDGDDEGASPGSADHSRSGTPGRMNASGSPSASMSAVPTVLARPDTAGPGTGQQSYYRQHTVNPVFVAPRTPHGVLDQSGTYQPVPQLPTSATRLHGANWPPAPPWIQDNGQRPVPGQQYSIHGVYYPGAYYRAPNGQPGMGPGPEHQVPGQAPMNGNEGHAGPSDERQRSEGHVVSNSNIDPNLSGGSSNDAEVKEGDGQQRSHTAPDATSLNDHDGINAAVRKALEAVLAIDPKLNQQPAEPTTNTTVPAEEINGQHSATADSALPQVQDTSQPPAEQAPGTSNPQENGQIDPDTDMDADADGEADVEVEGEGEVQPASVGQMLTEDGEPMLRPDELLNEESLASPPPS
ncbi:hypothetical protein BD410DRAFT_895115 [Rickenella mellea]|uniref:C2H2-type domain-containing protein n=1 Tax=Rickenella mellea TaxID=50990 RepID=A0A4Y7QH27_9AGAM|nr:hypothetical protein BD410DRAFT_895115 [Rickenella mellea]